MIKPTKIPILLLSIVCTLLLGTAMSLTEISAASSNLLPPPPVTQSWSIATGNDDVEEDSSGSISYGSSDLELVYDSGNQNVGLRFTNIYIPQGANILSAYLQFEVDESSSGTTNLIIEGHAHDDAPAFGSSSSTNVSGRNPTSSVSWSNIPSWSTSDAYQQSTDISLIIQQIVDRGGWSSGNDMAFMISGSGERVAESYESGASEAPMLFVTYDLTSCETSYPYLESWETDFGAWEQNTGDDGNWTRQSGGTPSGSTGPSSASNGSDYIFTESSSVFNKTMIIQSCFDLSNECSATFDFDYHMYGSSMGSLRLEISDDQESSWTTLFYLSGNQGNQWHTQSEDLTSYAGENIVLRFTGLTGSSYTSDIALDDLRLTTGSCIEICNNNVDDDGDGAIDSDDPDCDTCTSTELANRDFENNLTSWSNWGGTTTITEPNGNKFARTSNVAGGLGQNIPCVGGSTVTVTFYGKKDGSEYASAGFAGYNSGGTKVFSDLTASITSSSWESYSVSSVVPNDVTNINVFLWKGAGSGYADVDGFCVTIIPPSTPICEITPGEIADPVMDCNTSNPGIINSIEDASVLCNDLGNEEFDSGTSNWSMYAANGSSATWSVDNSSQLSGSNSAYINISAASGTDWHIEFEQSPLITSSSKTYDISFEAKSASPRTLYVSVQLRQSPWTEYWSTTVNLTTSAQTFTFDNISIPFNSSNMGLMFKMGLSTPNVYLDNIYIGEVDCGSASSSIVYQWQKREFISGSWGAWTNIAGATSETYNPPVINATTEYQRLTQVDECPTWEASNSVSAFVCAEICDDGIDNDGDGLIDCADADCNGIADCTPDCPTGNILVETFNGISGNFITDLTSAPNYPNSPSITEYITDLNRPDNYSDNYGTRIRGYIIPTQTGTYSFNITSDDNSELHLSSDLSASNTSIIASLNGWAIEGDHTKFASQTSSNITLQAGTYYYIEILQKEGTGGDNLEVYWKTPSNSTWTIIPGSNLSPYICVEICNDGIDNDGDGDIDCLDGDCLTTVISPSTLVNSGSWINQSSVTVCEGDEVSIGSQVGLMAGMTLTHPNASIDNTPTADTYFDLGAVTIADAGTYVLTYTNSEGCSTTQNVELIISTPEISEVSHSYPDNCPTMDNGSLTITATGSSLEYSIDNGSTWSSSNVFNTLTGGDYQIMIRNSVSLCTESYVDNPYHITVPICVEICDDSIDNDGDGDTDCDDSDCMPTVILSTDNSAICPSDSTLIQSSVCEQYDAISMVRPYGNNGWNNQFDVGGSGISGDGTLCFTLVDNRGGSVQMIGLNSDPFTNAGWTGIDFGLYIVRRTDNDKYIIYAREDGVNLSTIYNSTTSIAGTELCISREGTTVEYSIDGDVEYTSLVASSGQLYYDNSFYSSATHALYGGGYSYFNNISLCSSPDVNYNWSTAETTDSIYAKTSGTYTLTITDINGCTASDQIIITDDTCTEICDDGLDNDGDGDIDCDDIDCGKPSITTVTAEDPDNCPTQNNGTINIVASGSNLEYSIDDGTTYVSTPLFSGLNPGTYTIRVKNNITQCYTTTSTTLTDLGCIEDCDDLIDNDGDGDIDCADSECSPIVQGVTYGHPKLCPTLANGSIAIDATGANLEYSIDNGSTYVSSNSFNSLPEGTYTILVRNSVTNCVVPFDNNPVNLNSPICVEICNNSIDDDGDGDIDCADTDCQPNIAISAETNSICPSEEIILYTEACEKFQSISKQRPLSTQGWTNAFDYQSSGIAGDGELCFTLSDFSLSSLQTFGLNSDPDTDDDYLGIDFGINVAIRPDINQYTLQIRESGTVANIPYSSSTSFLNSTFCIRRTSSTIEYLMDGVVIYTSSVSSVGDLYYDHSIYSSTSSAIYLDGYSYFTDISLCGEMIESYSWNDASTLDSLIVNSAGTYSVTFTDINGCTNSDAIVISQGLCPEICNDGIDNDSDGDIDCDDADCGQPTITTVTPVDPSNCQDLDNGTITIIANGSNLTYSIDGGNNYQVSNTFTDLIPGDYNLRIQNTATGCFIDHSSTITLIQVPCPEICNDGIDNDLDGDIDCEDSDCGTPNLVSVTDQNIFDCIDLNDGQISISANASTGPGGAIEYSIDNGTNWSSTSNFTNLTAGYYNIRIRYVDIDCYLEYDNNPIHLIVENCPEICNDGVDNDGDGLIDCDDPDCLPAIDTIVVNNADNCPSLNNAFIHINTLENSDYEYSIDGGTFFKDGKDFDGLTAGTYNVRVRRKGTDCYTDYINNPIVIVNEICVEDCNDGIDNDGDGLIDCDDPDCMSATIDTIIVTRPDNCPILDNGTITISTTGTDLTYSINNGNTFQVSNTFNSLMNGNYNIVIKDTISGCELDYENNPLMLIDTPCPEICDDGIDNDGDGLIDCADGECGMPNISSVNIAHPSNCPSLNNGIITIDALGSNLEYSINGGSTYQSNNAFTGLIDGAYTIRVRNNVTGCYIDYINNNVQLTDPICVEICGDGIDNDGDGFADCDDSDCPSPNIIQVISNDPDNCPDLDNGYINIFATGNDKEFSIDGGVTFQTSNQFNNLSSGVYNIQVRNTEPGCYVDYISNSVIISEPICVEICGDGIDNDGDGNADCDDPDCAAPSYNSVTATTANNCPTLDNGSIVISASGVNLQYSINGGVSFQTSNTFSGLVAFGYTVVVKNSITGCEVDYPFNPVIVDEEVCAEICDDGIDNDGDGLIDCDDPECNPATIDTVTYLAPYNCPTLDNGSITIFATGDDLEYSITNGIIYQNSPTFTGLYNGSFNIKVRNKVSGCVLSYINNAVVLIDPECGEICNDGIDNDGDGIIDCADSDCGVPSSVGEDHTDPDNCYALNNGNILMDAVGSDVQYSIDGGITFQDDPSFDNLTAGTYYLVARNSETGCEANGPSVTLYNSTCNEICDDGIDNDGDGLIDCLDGNCGAPTVGLVTAYDPYNCPILDNGTISITGSGNDLEFSIDNGVTYQASSTFTGLAPGNYYIQLINTSTGCTTPYPNNPIVLEDPICGEICDDGIDNDGDGNIDCEDSECVNASNTYMINFDLDTPIITKYSDKVATAEGNVLYAADGTDAGFNYIVSMVIEGGPAGGSSVNFPNGSVLNDGEFNTNDPSIVYNGDQTVIDLDLQGQENINGTVNYYRDNTSNMTVTMYLDNGQAFSNVQYTIVDIDMDLTGSNGNYNGAYIDQVQILSGAGSNTITPYNSSYVKVIGDVARANFTDNNNNNRPDYHEFIQAQTFNPAGNITVNTPGTVSKIQFVYTDYGLGVDGGGSHYHSFNSGNQRVGLGTFTRFESGCQVIEICDDGIDNDGDGLTDCEDDDCNPVITFLSSTHTDNCPLLNNGTISIQAIGNDLEYSVDGGITYQTNSDFLNLTAGTYNVWVQNATTGCNVEYAFNPITITDPICVEICDDGIDNDGNGLTDCEDPACGVGEITNIVVVDPSNCPESDNGSLTISASGSNLEYSIDGGVTYQSSNYFDNLVARNYTLVIRNTINGCLAGYTNNPLSISPTNCACIGVDNAFRANFENDSGDNAWTFSNGATDGNFEVANPNPYNTNGILMEIVPYRGSRDLLTGNGNEQDLDGGEAVAQSRNINLSTHVTDISFDLQYYFSHYNNSDNNDYLRIEVLDASNNNVLTTIVSENGTASNRNAVWVGASANLTAHAGKTIYIRARTADYGGGSKVEVAIDDIEIIETPDVTLNLPFETFCTEQVNFVLSGGLPLGGSYSGPGIIDGTTFNAQIAGTGSHTITYTYTTNDGCDVTSTDVVVVNEVNVSGTATPSEICIGESTTIEAPTSTGVAPFVYNWDNGLSNASSHTVNPLVNTQYKVTVTDDNGCTAATFINVTVYQPPTSNLSVDGSNCYEDNITQLDLDVSGGAPSYTFAYSGPSGFTSTEQNPTVPSAGIYNVTVTDNNGCTVVDTVQVYDPFVPTIGGEDEMCYGESTILTAYPSGQTYQWNAFAGGGSTDQVSVTPLSTTTYVVTVTNSQGCTSSADITVTVNPTPEVTITADHNISCSAEEINITATIDNSIPGVDYYYQWSSISNSSSITVYPTTNTTYTLTITDSNMCQVVDSINVTVNEAEIENVTLGSNVACDGSCTGDMIIDVDYPSTGPFIIYYDYGGTTFSAGPYDFGVNPDTAIVIGDLCAGSYSNITIQGTNTGCTDLWTGDDVEISESHADWEHVTHTSDVSNCSGVCDGSFTVDANLGTTGQFEITYTFEGNTITDGPYNFAGDILIDGLCEGIYSDITITSIETGCQDIWPTDIEINTPDPRASIVSNISDDCQIGEGSVTINVSGGVIPYTIYWKSEDGSETGSEVFNFHGNHTIYGLSGGITYCFEITDSNGCSTSN